MTHGESHSGRVHETCLAKHLQREVAAFRSKIVLSFTHRLHDADQIGGASPVLRLFNPAARGVWTAPVAGEP